MIEQSQLHLIASTFVGRRNDYALQRDTGRYVRTGQPLTYEVLRLHMQGIHTVGTYVIDEQGTCRFAVFDADRDDGFTVLSRLQTRLERLAIPSYLEDSRRGGHLWVFLSSLVTPAHLRWWLLPYCPDGVEFYPKQDASAGYGSLIRLPFGVHRVTRQRYWFATVSHGPGAFDLTPIKLGSFEWLSTLRRATVPDLSTLSASAEPLEQNTRQSLTKSVSIPETPLSSATIRTWCASQDTLSVMSRYVRLDRRGLGCCPFGEHHSDGKDTHPSFRAYAPRSAGGSCWYCYAWQQGGTLFNFLQRYYRLDARTLWHRILTGETF